MTRHYNNENYNNDEILNKKKKACENQAVFDEETLSYDKACRKCYMQKQKLINEDD